MPDRTVRSRLGRIGAPVVLVALLAGGCDTQTGGDGPALQDTTDGWPTADVHWIAGDAGAGPETSRGADAGATEDGVAPEDPGPGVDAGPEPDGAADVAPGSDVFPEPADASDAIDVPDVPDASDVLDASDAADTGEVPDTSDAPDTSDVADTSDIPGPDAGPEPCPAGVICVASLPFADDGSTAGAASDLFDHYGCAPGTDESGPEVLYRVEVPADGFLAVDLPQEGMSAGVDVDVHLLDALDPDACIGRGHWRAGSFVPAGTYWVVVDTWVSASSGPKAGDYKVTIGLTTVEGLVDVGMKPSVAFDALYAYGLAWQAGDAGHFGYAVTDFSLDAGTRRMWVLDMATGDALWRLHVAHGEASADASDPGKAVSFSNVSGSHQSSLGMVQAAEPYMGSYGYSMRLDGLEPGYNSLVRPRAIVVHPWSGSSPEYVDAMGYAAPTWGCPALDPAVTDEVVDFLSDGGLLLFHYPDGDWSDHSAYLP